MDVEENVEQTLLKFLGERNQAWFEVYNMQGLSISERIVYSHWLRARMGRPRRRDAVFVIKKERYVEHGMPRIRWLIGKKLDLKVSSFKRRQKNVFVKGEERPE